jgi:hypothetical protein
MSSSVAITRKSAVSLWSESITQPDLAAPATASRQTAAARGPLSSLARPLQYAQTSGGRVNLCVIGGCRESRYGPGPTTAQVSGRATAVDRAAEPRSNESVDLCLERSFGIELIGGDREHVRRPGRSPPRPLKWRRPTA